MLKTIIRLSHQHPDLAGEYLSAYTLLVQSELSNAKKRMFVQMAWLVTSMIFASAFIIVLSVAVMLTINSGSEFDMVFWAAPATLLMLTVLSALTAQHYINKKEITGITQVLEQLGLDKKLLASATESL